MNKLKSTAWLLIAMVLTFSACSDGPTTTDPDTNDDGEKVELQAEISYSPQSPVAGDEITLDASGSKDDQNVGFDAEWALTAPSGSAVTLSSSDQMQTTFTPDVVGDYVIDLKISNSDEGVSDEAQATIIVEDPSKSFVELSGSIDSDMTLEDIFEDSDRKDYLVTSELNVNATLTVEPGVVIHFDEGVLMGINGSGTIIAEGTASDSITFTSSNQDAGLLWDGLLVRSSTALNSLRYVEVSHAGNSAMDFAYSDHKAAVGVLENGKLSIENSFIHHNEGYGVYADNDGGVLETFAANRLENNTTGMAAPANTISSISSDNQFTDNQKAAVEIPSTTFNENNEDTWNNLADGSAYYVSGDLQIDGTLTIAPGAHFEMAEDVLWEVFGALIANGTSKENISFTTYNETGGLYWKGIHIISADSRNSFKHVDLSYGGNSAMDFSYKNYPALLGVESSGKVSVSHSTISDSKGYGLYIDNDGGQIEEFSSNSFINNMRAVGVPANEADEMDSNTTFTDNSKAEVEIFDTNYSEDRTSSWKPLSGDAAYRISGDIEVKGELTIEPGARFEVDEDVLVQVDGALIARGEEDKKIVFTSSNIGGGLHWKGLYFRSSSSQKNILEYVDIGYAGNSKLDFSHTDYAANVGINENARLTIKNSRIYESRGYGIYSKGITNDYANAGNTFKANPMGNVSSTIE